MDADTLELTTERLGRRIWGSIQGHVQRSVGDAIKVFKAEKHESYIPQARLYDIESEALIAHDSSSNPYILSC